MYFAQAIRYGILYAVNQLARAMPMPAKAQVRAEVHLLRYLVGSTDFFIANKQGDFRVALFLDAYWGNTPDNGWPTLSYIVMLANTASRWDCRADRTVLDGSRDRKGGSRNEGGSGILLQHDVGAGLR